MLVHEFDSLMVTFLFSFFVLFKIQYLYKACPRYFPESMVSSLPEWPMDTESCAGTLGMKECIQQRAGTIGYLDAGTGVREGFAEISIPNKYGRLLTSQDAIRNNGIGVRQAGVLPDDPRDDFGAVSLLDQDGEWTWPITLISFVYVRQDLSFLENPNERSLLVAFLKALYDPSLVEQCNTKFDFTLASGHALDVAKKGIALLEGSLTNESRPWTFEDVNVQEITGAGDFVISSKRRNYARFDRENNFAFIQELQVAVQELQQELALLKEGVANDQRSSSSSKAVEFEEKHEAQIMAGLILASAAMGFVLLGMVIYCGQLASGSEDEKPEAATNATMTNNNNYGN